MLFSVVILVALAALWAGLSYSATLTAARSRKFIYAGAILVLFFAMLFHRRSEVEDAADRHDLRETNIGEVDLGGSASRFTLTCFRGPLICMLWWDATELMAKHEFHELEQRYKSLTKLQPHFRSPWLYQGWNLAYNVSVEFDRVEDKYFYISEGIRWLAEGERINRARIYDPERSDRKREVGDPDMRWNIGFMIQDKMSVSDEVNTHRCFLHLSCIPPGQWDPSVLRRNSERLEQFKRTYPQLVRQIRLLRNIPEGAEKQLNNELLAFFSTHRRLPSLYPGEVDGTPQSAEPSDLKRFPIWPEKLAPRNPEQEDSHDPYDIAKCWYVFANEPLPEPFFDAEANAHEARYHRMPKRMISLIFRKQPAQAKAKQGDQLGKDGWFKESQKAWQEAFDMWLDYGNKNRLELKQEIFDELMVRALRYFRRFPEEAMGDQFPSRMYRSDPEVVADWSAFIRMKDLEQRRRDANYPWWRSAAETNASDGAVAARRHIYNAKANRSDIKVARQEFEKGLALWKNLLVKPRKLDPHTDAAFLLNLGPQPALLQSFVIQPLELFVHTEFGKEGQANEEIVEIQDQYVLLHARDLGPRYLEMGHTIWELANILGKQAAGVPGPLAAIPAGRSPLSLNYAENVVHLGVAPLDLYILREYIGRSVRFKSQTEMPAMSEAARREGGGQAPQRPPPLPQ